jgi:acyl carrier protein
MEREEILGRIKEYMVALFDVPADSIVLTADLSKDLDLDSIDAIDLVVKLQELTVRKIKPDEFKTVRTVSDVVDRIYEITNVKST